MSIITIIIYFDKRPLFLAKLGLDVCPKYKSLYISQKIAHLGCKPSSFMSFLTHCSHVFLLKPRPIVPSTTNLLQADTQSGTLLSSRCVNHLNLPRLTTSATQLIPRRMHKSSLTFSVFQGHPTHPSHHHTLCPFQTSQIISLHCPCFSFVSVSSLSKVIYSIMFFQLMFICGAKIWDPVNAGLSLETAIRPHDPMHYLGPRIFCQ